mmetsp:Transcript_29939/g.41454  ORF Transcript_29939/g.41454 Transcript_29939/m.41454 type:complete len:484 (-) Transcript_29939:223-1674(-)
MDEHSSGTCDEATQNGSIIVDSGSDHFNTEQENNDDYQECQPIEMIHTVATTTISKDEEALMKIAQQLEKLGLEKQSQAITDVIEAQLGPKIVSPLEEGSLEAPVNMLVRGLSLSRGTALVYDESMMLHTAAGNHPECPGRILEIWRELTIRGLVQQCIWLKGRRASLEELQAVHTASLTETLIELKGSCQEDLINVARRYNSVFLNSHSVDCALLAAGCVLRVVEQVMSGSTSNGACVVRPPGHHAEAARCMGFCLLNSVAIAASLAQTQLGAQRVLVLDWDVHHGNGTQEIFQSNPNVLFISIHRYEEGSFYPGVPEGAGQYSGSGAGTGFTVNVAWDRMEEEERRLGDADYKLAMEQIVMPIAREFNPTLVLVSAGFDAMEGDPLGGCEVSSRGFAHMTQLLRTLADGKVVLCLEGGYNIEATARGFADCVEVLLGKEMPAWEDEGEPCSAGLRAVKETRIKHASHWGVLVQNTNEDFVV